MPQLTVGDVLEMAVRPEDGSQDRLQQLFSWSHERAMAQATSAFSVSGAVLSPLLAAVFTKDISISPLIATAYLLGSALAAAGGLLRLWRLRRLDAEFVEALHIFSLGRQLARRGPFARS
jgi:protein-S-isoprenylcysteine O-methyltransferase Ste14